MKKLGYFRSEETGIETGPRQSEDQDSNQMTEEPMDQDPSRMGKDNVVKRLIT